MENERVERDKNATLRSWLIVTAIAVTFLCWGLFIFYAVGDKGQPSWDFNVVEDIPGQSPYSTHRAKPFFASPEPLHGQQVPGVTGKPDTPVMKGER